MTLGPNTSEIVGCTASESSRQHVRLSSGMASDTSRTDSHAGKKTLDEQAREHGVYGFEIAAIHQGRRVTLATGQNVTDFATNCPFGINELPAVQLAAIRAINSFGGLHASIASARATTYLTRIIIDRLAEMKGPASSARIYPTTLSANTATADGIKRSGAQIVIDPRSHATMMSAVSGIPQERVTISKNSVSVAEAYSSTCTRTVFLAGDGLYSMGKFADYEAIRRALLQCPNLRVWLDDAHSVGMHGRNGRGEAMEQLYDFANRVVVSGSFGKAFGAAGGFVVAPESFIDEMLKASVADRFSCNLDVAAQGAIVASMNLLSDSNQLRSLQRTLEQRLAQFDGILSKQRIVTEQHGSKIAFRLVPFNGPEVAIEVAGKMLTNGVMTTPVYYPTIGKGTGGIRVSISAAHSPEQVDALATMFVDAL